jgi:hypothetical protein
VEVESRGGILRVSSIQALVDKDSNNNNEGSNDDDEEWPGRIVGFSFCYSNRFTFWFGTINFRFEFLSIYFIYIAVHVDSENGKFEADI